MGYREDVERIIGRPLRARDRLLALERVSTDESTQLSIPDQHDITEAFSRELGIPIEHHYVDLNSRDTWPRETAEALLTHAKEPHIVGIAVWESSRLIGNEDQYSEIRRRMVRSRVAFVNATARRMIDPRDRDEVLKSFLEAWQSGNEVHRTRTRVRTTHLQKFERGKFIQHPPAGLRFDPDASRNGEVVVWPEQLAAVRRLFDLVGRQGRSLDKATKILAAEGAPTFVYYRCDNHLRPVKQGQWRWPDRPPLCKKCGEPAQPLGSPGWYMNSARRILANRFYLGEMTWNRRETVRLDGKKTIVERPREQWLTQPTPFGNLLAHDTADECPGEGCAACADAHETFRRANELIALRRKTKSTKRKHPGRPLDLVVRCERCGGKLYLIRSRYQRKDGTRSDVWEYQCGSRRGSASKCQKAHQIAENTLRRRLQEFIDAGDCPGKVTVRWVRPDLTEDRCPALQKVVREAKAALRAAVRDRLAAGSDEERELIQEAVDEANERLAVAKAELAALDAQREPEPTVQATADARAFLADATATWWDPAVPFDRAQAAVARAIVTIRVDHPEVRVEIRERRAVDRAEPAAA
jgi:DNA invertase Pin-like site-specific DNA recombinase